MEAIVVKRVSFDAAHFLPNYEGACRNMHGHHWVLEVGIRGKVRDDGMVVDFKVVKDILQPFINNFDHQLMNDTIENPTAENIALYVKGKIKNVDGVEFVRVWETNENYAEVR